jgi:hypothetical protein
VNVTSESDVKINIDPSDSHKSLERARPSLLGQYSVWPGEHIFLDCLGIAERLGDEAAERKAVTKEPTPSVGR